MGSCQKSTCNHWIFKIAKNPAVSKGRWGSGVLYRAFTSKKEKRTPERPVGLVLRQPLRLLCLEVGMCQSRKLSILSFEASGCASEFEFGIFGSWEELEGFDGYSFLKGACEEASLCRQGQGASKCETRPSGTFWEPEGDMKHLMGFPHGKKSQKALKTGKPVMARPVMGLISPGCQEPILPEDLCGRKNLLLQQTSICHVASTGSSYRRSWFCWDLFVTHKAYSKP